MDEQQFKQLEALLASPICKGRAMRPDRLQGFLCALISGPDPIPASAWLPIALGGEPEYASPEQKQQLTELIMDLFRQLSDRLHRHLAPELILYPAGSGSGLDYRPWCEGYISGWSLSKREWLLPGNEPLKHLTLPILLLSGAFREDAERRGESFAEDEEYRNAEQQCMEMLPEAVLGIHDFWHAPKPVASTRREFPKAGRNDPCPCGSGKKFKRCCGSVLH